MLTPGKIPDQEPLISVGIVLPEDRQTTLQITLFDPANSIVRLDQEEPFTPQDTTFSIVIQDDHLTINNCELSQQLSITTQSVNTGNMPVVSLSPVTAGRGFHWEKEITVDLQGNIQIKIHEGSLLVINELPLENYLMSVATSEMGADSPSALLEAQTIVARSWMLANVEQKHRDLGFDVCNDDCCQRYQGTANLTDPSISAVNATRGKVLQYENNICDARYSKSCGGMMESFETIWPGEPHPYLQIKPDMPAEKNLKIPVLMYEEAAEIWINDAPPAFCGPQYISESELTKYIGTVDEEGEYFRWKTELTQLEFTDLLNKKLDLNAQSVVGINPVHRGGSGRLYHLQIHYRDSHGETQFHDVMSEFQIRECLDPDFLYSSAVYFELQDYREDLPQRFIIHGAGWGHGVGLCQIGALGMALADHSTEQILAHYYPGSVVNSLYS